MALTYEQLTEMLLQAGEPFTIQEPRSDGKTNVYRGRDARAFLEHRDNRLHEHKVFDQRGRLIYHRDLNGRVYIGDPAQIRKYERNRKAAGSILSILQQSWDGALRHWGMR